MIFLQVLFRNNFALSRDITGLFQSFQSSSTVLDPAANPTLFKSMLVIIIKVRVVFVLDLSLLIIVQQLHCRTLLNLISGRSQRSKTQV